MVKRNTWALGAGNWRTWHMPVGDPPMNGRESATALCGVLVTGAVICDVTSIGDAPSTWSTCPTCHERYVASLREPVKPEPLWSPYQDIAAVAS